MNDTPKELAAFLERADALACSNEANPCAEPRDGDCLQRELAIPFRGGLRDFRKVREDSLCEACAVSWHIARARAMFMAIRRHS